MKTVILAGGLGTRLSEETNRIPKPMVEIGDRPILWHIMQVYARYGFTDFVICLGYKGDVIRDYFLEYHKYNRDFTVTVGKHEPVIEYHNRGPDWKVTLVETGALTTTGGRLSRVADYLDDQFFLTYGDGLANINLHRLAKLHSLAGKLATITAVRPPARFGEISIEENTVTSFAEKPQLGRGWINGGFMMFNKGALEVLDTSVSLEEGLLTTLSKQKQLAVYQHDEAWGCCDTQRELQEMNNLWSTNKAFWKVWE